MDFTLSQRGRAAINFAADIGRALGQLQGRVADEIKAAGISPETLADDLDQRVRQIDQALTPAKAFPVSGLMGDWASINHGRIAIDAFEEIRPQVEPKIQAAMRGPTTIETKPGFSIPQYFQGVEFHRTTGGWDGHEHMGFIHGELIHKHYVAKNFPGDIFAQRRQVLSELPRQDYRRIFEIGTSSGHYTIGLQQTFPAAEIWGCDLSLAMLQQAQRTANERGWRWRLRLAPGEDTGLPAGSFDLVTSYIVLHEIPADIVRAQFREAYRLLEPGGDVLMSDVTPFSEQDKLSEWRAYNGARNGGEPYWRESASLDLKTVAEEAGFVNVRSFGLGPRKYPWVTYGHKPAA